jgi:hypothetical protein
MEPMNLSSSKFKLGVAVVFWSLFFVSGFGFKAMNVLSKAHLPVFPLLAWAFGYATLVTLIFFGVIWLRVWRRH